MKTVIIDDEVNTRQLVEALILKYYPEMHICGMADGVQSGIAMINKEQPNLVFLDINMKDGTGFDLLNQLDLSHLKFTLVFITESDEYAIKALKFGAFDYLLKPLDPEEFKESVNRIASHSHNMDRERLTMMVQEAQSQSKFNKLALPTSNGVHLVDFQEIIHCKGDGSYTQFYLKDQKSLITSKNLSLYDDLLPEESFFRVHQSHLVNIKEIAKIIKHDGGCLIMSNGEKIPISRRKKDEFFSSLGV